MILAWTGEVKIVPRRFRGFGIGIRSRGSVAAMAVTRVAATPLGTLFGGDAVAWLRTLPTGSVDLVFADPPYNLGREAWDDLGTQSDYLAWSDGWIREAVRVLRRDGSLYICGFSEVLADVKAVAAPHFAGCRWLIWYYKNKANLGRDWGRSHESILHLRGPDHALDVDAVRVPYNGHTTKYPTRIQAVSSQYGGGTRRDKWEPHPLGAKPRDVIEVPVICNGMTEKTPHATQKPEALIERLILASSQKGQLVVDPFVGSGTTAVVAERLERRWLAGDGEARYVGLARDRLGAPR